MINATKSMSARFGYIKRRLVREEPLTGKHLELALDIVGDGNTGYNLMDGIAYTLNRGQKLDPYELHLMIDVFLRHAKLGFASSARCRHSLEE